MADVLADKKKSINKDIGRIRRAEKAAGKLFEALNMIDELEDSENCYRKGDEFFKEEHEQYVKFIGEIESHGYTIEEVRNLKDYYGSEYAKQRSRIKVVKRELRIAEELIREESKKSERQITEKKEENRIQEKDRQPVK